MNSRIIDWLIESGHFLTSKEVIDSYNRYLEIEESDSSSNLLGVKLSDEYINRPDDHEGETDIHLWIKDPSIIMMEIIDQLTEKPYIGKSHNGHAKLTFESRISAELSIEELEKIPGIVVTLVN